MNDTTPPEAGPGPGQAKDLTAEQAFAIARDHQAKGDLAEAKRIYEGIVRLAPFHSWSLTMLSSIAYQQGHESEGQAFLDRAIRALDTILTERPGNNQARSSLVNSLLARGRQGDAERIIAGMTLPLNPLKLTPEAFLDQRKAALAKGLPSILINALPKSASETIWNHLAAGLHLPQCHISLGLFPDCTVVPSRAQGFGQGGVISKEHLPATPHNLSALKQAGVDRLIFHVRDPRQATLSWAHFVREDVAMRLLAPIWRRIVPPAEVLKGSFEATLDWCIQHYLPLVNRFIADWAKLDEANTGIAVTFLNFEGFLAQPDRYFEEVLAAYGLKPEQMDSEAKGEDKHLRKGARDEWRDVFSPKQAQKAWAQLDPALAKRFGWQA